MAGAKLSSAQPAISPVPRLEDEDSLVWRELTTFSQIFTNADTAVMNRFLPDDFILQWMHENFIGKRNLVNTMMDSAIRHTMEFRIIHDANAILTYSDDHSAVCLNTGFQFQDENQMKSIVQQHGYGLCIVYLKKVNTAWCIKTIHLDLHCQLCNF